MATKNIVSQGLLPYSRVWAVTKDYSDYVRGISPELYAALRADPQQFAELSRAGTTPDPLFAMGVTTRARRPVIARQNPGGAVLENGAAPVAGVGEPSAYSFWDDDEEDEDKPPYDIVNGVALLSVNGPMTKKPTSGYWLMGGTSTTVFRKNVRHAASNPNVGAILIDFDTPGGMVAGTASLADDIAAISRDKIVEAYVEDMCASAGYWVASQARYITVGRAAQVGSIGVYMVVEDLSKMYADMGIEVFVFKAGKFKGAGEDGTKLDPDQQKEFQREVDALNVEFAYKSVKTGRNMSDAQVAAVNTGQVWLNDELIDLGLVDAVGSYSDVLDRLSKEVVNKGLAKTDAVPGAVRGRSGPASRLLLPAGASAGVAGIVATAAMREDAERPAAMYAGRSMGASADTIQTPEPTEDGQEPGATTEPEGGDVTSPPSGDTTQEGDGQPEPTDATGGEETTAPTTPTDAAGGETTDTTEETETMGNEPNNNTPAATTPIDSNLAARITALGISSVSDLNAMARNAEDGKKARASLLGSIQGFAVRIAGASAVDAEGQEDDGELIDVQATYGALGYEALNKINANMAKTWGKMAKHAGQEDGTLPLGAPVTQPAASTAGIGGAIDGANAAGPQGNNTPTNEDPTGYGLKPVDAKSFVQQKNRERNGKPNG